MSEPTTTAPVKRRFRGPDGAIFVPAKLVDEDTIKAKVASGEWTPLSR